MKKKNLLISSLNNNFLVEIIELLKNDFNVKIEMFYETTENERIELLKWANIIFCEWCDKNAIWYSKKKCNDQKLIIRLHRYELFTTYIYNIKWDNVNNLIFIAPEIKNITNKIMLQRKYINECNFDWEFYLTNNVNLFENLDKNKYNKKWAWNHWINIGSKTNYRQPEIKLNENINYDQICEELNKFNGGIVIYNYTKSLMFDVVKQENYKFNIGIMGIIPKLKRLDIAIDIIEKLIKTDNRYKLYVLSKNYKNCSITNKNEIECMYYEKIYKKIEESEILKYNVIMDEYTENPEIWFKKIGYLLSVSDVEGSHQAVAEAMASKTIPIIYGNALKKFKLDKIYPNEYCFYEDNIDNLCKFILNTSDEKYKNLQNKCEEYAKRNFKLLNIYEQIKNVME